MSQYIYNSQVVAVIPGTNVTVDSTDPQNPIVASTGGGGGGSGTVTSVAAGDGTITIGGTPTIAPTVKVTAGIFDAAGAAAAAQAASQPLDSDLTTFAALTATTDSFLQAKAGAWTTRTIAQVQTDIAAIPLSVVTASGDIIYATGAAAVTRLAAGVATQQLVGGGGGPAWSSNPAPSVVALTDGATVAVSGTSGPIQTLVAAGNRTILTPSNAANGRRLIIAHTASVADRQLTLTTGSAGAFEFGTDILGLSLTTLNTTDYIGCIYDSTAARWRVVSYVKGFA